MRANTPACGHTQTDTCAHTHTQRGKGKTDYSVAGEGVTACSEWTFRHVLSPRSDKTCRKVHSLHVFSLLRQQRYNLSFSFLVVCVCVRALTCVCLCLRARARAHVCVCVCRCAYFRGSARAATCVLLCIVLCLLSPPQSALN